MSRTWIRFAPRSTRFPRVSGDEPAAFWYILDDEVFSPRERG